LAGLIEKLPTQKLDEEVLVKGSYLTMQEIENVGGMLFPQWESLLTDIHLAGKA
jgi:hypothetical protein